MPAERLDAAERELCRQADVVFTTAPGLQAALAPFNPATYCFGNVADVNHFSKARDESSPCPPELLKIHAPRLVFIGAIDAYKLDLPLLEGLARATPEWSYVLIGPVGETDPSTDVKGLQSLPNVHLLGPRTYASLPSYLAHADVTLLPLQLNDYTLHMFPMKFFEYLAAGCQVVGTAIPSLHDQSDVAMLTEPSPAKFRLAITKVLAGEGPALVTRLSRAALHTYQKRTQDMINILEIHGLLPVDSSSVPPPQRLML
jgi:glycosyltransferase involved in cell wall biosynthesis